MANAKTICVLTGSRAEYGLLHPFLSEVQRDNDLDLQILVTGMHLSEKFGSTWKAIVEDGFDLSAKVPILEDDNSELGVAHSTGAGVSKIADALSELQPDLLVVLGDRFETFAGVVAATFLKIPVAHFHGGETTEGAFDESLRHCITKMSHLHFTSTETYRNRVVQLGESPNRVFNVGAVGLDNTASCDLLDQETIERQTGIRFQDRNVIVTFHPVTLQDQPANEQFCELISALESLDDLGVIITHPNADPGSEPLMDLINEFVGRNQSRAWQFQSLGFVRYLSILPLVDAVVGNSSSGLIEAPHFRTPTVNIGERQLGRLAGPTVIHCDPSREAILKAIRKSFSEGFQKEIAMAENPYGMPGASRKALEEIKRFDLQNVLMKQFFDLSQY